MEGRQSWRVAPVCKTGPERVSEFESHPLHQQGVKMNNLFILSEEVPQSFATILNIIESQNKTRNVLLNKIADKERLVYEIFGHQTNYDKVYYVLTSKRGKGSFVDYMCFEGESFPNEQSIPFLFIEETKNSGKDAGNMLTQRLTKWNAIDANPKYINARKVFLIKDRSSILDTEKSFKRPVSVADFRCYATYGVDVYISDYSSDLVKKLTFQPYTSILDMEEQENKRIRSSNSITQNNSQIYIEALLKKGGGTSDPNIGYVSSRSWIINKLEPNNKIIIGKKHQMPQKWFEGKNKLTETLRHIGVDIEFEDGSLLSIPTQKNVFDEYAWKYERKNEKIASISLEMFLISEGWQIIFTNHGGTSKSYVKTENEYFATKKGNGLPDLVAYKDGKLIVIEAEQYKNYTSGLRQTKTFGDFVQKEILDRMLDAENVTVKYFLALSNFSEPKPHVLWGLTKDMEIWYNSSCEEIK